jgi:nucleoside-diphosphate-sugar epimerase
MLQLKQRIFGVEQNGTSSNTVLITGAGGFIGHHIVREFAKHNWTVYALIHRRLPEELNSLSNVHIIKGSVTEPDILTKITAAIGKQPDVVVHAAGLAADVGPDRIYKALNFESVQTFASLPTRKLVYLSSSDVYGIKDFHGEDEDTLPFETNPLSPYPKYKIESEKWLRANFPTDKYVILRPCAVYGEGDKSIGIRMVKFLTISPFIIHFGKWKGQNRWPATAVENVARVAYTTACCTDFDGKAINIIDPEYVTMEAFYRRVVAEHFPKKKFTSVTVPFWVGKLLGRISTTLSNWLGRTEQLFDPSFYAVHHVASNLDFSGARQQQVLEKYKTLP